MLLYLPFLVVAICWSLLGSNTWCQLFGIAACSCICHWWLCAVVDLSGQLLDSMSDGRSARVDNVALLGDLLPDFDVIVTIGLQLVQYLGGLGLMNFIEFVILASLALLSWNSGMQQWELLLTLGTGLQIVGSLLGVACHKPLKMWLYSLASC
jgi:hypothetical protein